MVLLPRAKYKEGCQVPLQHREFDEAGQQLQPGHETTSLLDAQG